MHVSFVITVDGQVKCEKWVNGEDNQSNEPKGAWWLKRVIKRRTDKVTVDWPYPFVENKLFVLTLTAGLEGYHINVDGRHVTSFPYRTVRIFVLTSIYILPWFDCNLNLLFFRLSPGEFLECDSFRTQKTYFTSLKLR